MCGGSGGGGSVCGVAACGCELEREERLRRGSGERVRDLGLEVACDAVVSDIEGNAE